jgi:transposase
MFNNTLCARRGLQQSPNGLPQAIAVTTANVADRDGAIEMIKKSKQNLPRVKNSLLDGGYSGEKFATSIKEILGANVEIVKRSELHKFTVIPRRWVVERSFAWLEKCRRLWKNCERKLSTSLAMVQLAFVRLLIVR